MFGPHSPQLFIGRKFTTASGGFRARDSGFFFGRERHRRFINRADQPENDTGDVVLRLRAKTAHRFERLIEKFCHHAWPILSVRWTGKASAFAGECKH